VIGQGEPLDVAEEPGPKAQDEPLAGVRAQQRRAEILELTERGDDHDQGSDQDQQLRTGAGAGRGQERHEHLRNRPRADDAVDGDLQWQRRQQLDGCGQHTQCEQPGHVHPIGARLLDQPLVQRELRAAVVAH
jgi:hypothetical protein